ncbi:MAG: hypothetical protein M1536_02560 [Firmicutes bacterium]|nr:hypothetical protein [Bacillota bacterium]
MDVISIIKLVHILSFFFMSAPFYSLIVVNERAKVPGKDFKVDRYLENIVKGQAMRCYVFQLTALITGVLLVHFEGMGLSSILTNYVLLLKTVLLLALMGLLSFVHLGIQPKIESLLSQVKEGTISDEIFNELRPWRLKRKKLAAFCLFVVLVVIILGMQVFVPYNAVANGILLILAAFFSWHVYKHSSAFGWI